MRLARFLSGGVIRIGRVAGESVVDLSELVDHNPSMRSLLTQLSEKRALIENYDGQRFALSEVTLVAPIDDPQKYLAIGMNYKAHAEESAAAGHHPPKYQLWFNKQVSCITGPYSDIVIPAAAPDQVDYEAELGVVIGKRCRNVSYADARSVVAGYVVCNDVTARDWQFRTPTYTLGKSFDTHGPIGPWITTDDEIEDPHKLELSLTLNGEERQRTSTGDMIYNIWDQIKYISTVMTLEPGDLIATGTPANVGIATNTFMKPGDVVRVSVTRLGSIENRFVAE